MDLVFKHTPNVPFWPQLPKRDFHEGMVAQLRENVGRLGDRELAIEFAKQDSAQARRVPPPIRKYIAGLIQSRRSETVQQKIENIDLWKHKQIPRMTPQRTRGQRI